MIVLTFRSKKDKEHMLEKAKKLEAYAEDIVECLEEAEHDEYEDYYSERRHHDDEEYRMRGGRYGYKK